MNTFVVPLRGLLCLLPAVLVFSVQAQTSLDREPPGPSSRRTGLAITEIMYNPRPVPGQASNFTHEFIEVFNSKPWAEDLGGFSITGSVSYVFPPNTLLGPGAYLVVARAPGLIVTNYGITNVLGPWAGAETNGLSTEEGTVQLRHRLGALLLEVNYEDSPPWPEGADGTGHSLVLTRPSYGEDDFRAWAQSDVTGGSPGQADPAPVEPMATVFINEWQHHSDPVDWVELYNHANDPVDVSGARITDNPQGTNFFRIPDGTSIPGRGFLSYDQNQLGFQLFAGGETLFLWNSNRTRVIDVIDFRGGSNNVSQGRWPDGGPNIYNLTFRANGLPGNTPNPRPMRSSVVISEIMFNPISGSLDDEYIEIVNRNNSPVSLAGWEFVTGINYLFATNALTMAMPPGAHWVIARNPTNLMAIHTNLSTNVNLFGPYGGTLANGGERVILAAADYDIVQGSPQPERLNVPMSELIYGDGGKWGNWIDGQGSSLELIDYEGDERHPSNWADSTDVPESLWTHIEYNGPVGELLGTPFNERLILNLQGIGECLVDEVEVRVDNGPNLVVNGGFESGLAGWAVQGSHDFSTIENAGYAGSKSLHVRAGSRGDNQSNRILSPPLASVVPAGATNVSLRAKVKWLRGHPEFLLRLHGSATEAYGRLALPRRLGSPGNTNSVRAANLGPAIYEVKHAPPLPAPGADVLVTARATDRQNPITLTLRYRVDPAPAYADVVMRDDGTGGDAIMNDGIYSGLVPGQADGALVAFYVEGRDNLNGVGTFPNGVFPAPGFTRCWPNDAVARECVVRWGEVQMPGDFATYHLWVTAANSNRWHTRDTQNNTSMDGTFVYNNARVIYNALPLFSGSPWHRTNATSGPAGTNRVDYEMNFPDDEPLVGATDFVLNNPGNPDRLTISDLSAVAEQTVYKIFEGLGMVNNHRRYIHFFVNGSQRSTCYERPGHFIFEDSQQPNGDMINQWFPDDAGGLLFKVEDWFEFNDNGFDITAFNDADLARVTTMIEGQPVFLPGPYRYKFRKRSVNVGLSANDYTAIYSLIDAASPVENPNGATVDPDLLGTALNWEEWMRHFAVQRAVGNWDSYGWERGKNDYLYTTAAGFVHMPWDIDYSMGLGRGPTEPLFASNDPRVAAMFNTPAIVRAYWRAFDELVNGPFSNAYLDPHIDVRANALLANNVNIDPAAVAAIKSYIGNRRTFIQGQLATVAAPFVVFGPTNFSTADNLVFITGSAPVNVKDILLNGGAYPITWTSATNFQVRVVLGPGANALTLEGLDRFGALVPGASITLGAEYTGPVPDPVGALTLAELHYAPLAAGQQFIEIVNRSTFAFDLAGWRIDGVTLTFPAGSIVTNGQTIVLAQNRNAFRAAFGNGPVFALFGGSLSAAGEPVALLRPAGFGYDLIDGVRYESVAPWSGVMTGQSLQLIDAAQDNSRPGNWAGGDPTPGATNAVAGAIAAYDPIWLNEIQIVSLVSNVLDNAGEPEPWIELFNNGPTPLNLGGYFLASSVSNNPTEFPFPPGTMIAPGEHLLIWADGEPGETDGTNLHTGFRLDSSGELALVRLVAGQPQVTDYLKWTRLGANTAHGGSPDGQSVYRFTLHHPTPRDVNATRLLRVFVNEWMARNANGLRDTADNPPAADDWFEIYNAENFTVNLGGFFLTDDTNSPTLFQIPDNGRYQIPPRGYLLVWADEQTNQNTLARADLHADFRLGSSSGAIGLFAPDGITSIDVISYGAQAQDIGEGRYADGASVYPYAMPLASTNSTPRGTNTIAEYNSPPLFLPTSNQIAVPGQNCCGPNGFVDLRSLDPDGDLLTYSVVSGPPGALINGARYRWPVPANQPPGEYPVVLRVTDNGTPPRSDLGGFTILIPGPGGPVVVVTGPPIYRQSQAAGQFTFSFESTVGRRYRILHKDDLNAPDWLPLGPDFVAANDSASVTDPLAAASRFYVVLPLD
jgi:hypothetical protein